jgi:hypothetical protein
MPALIWVLIITANIVFSMVRFRAFLSNNFLIYQNRS